MNSNVRRWVALVVVCFGQLMIVLDSTIVNVALPSIQHDLKFSQADLTWVVNSHWIFFITLPIGLLTLVFGAWLIAENRGLGLSHGVDVIGAILITAALMLAVYAIVTASDMGWASAHTLGFGGAALALMAA